MRGKKLTLLFILAGLCLLMMFFSIGIGAVPIAPQKTVQVLIKHCTHPPLSVPVDTTGAIIWQLRLPRIILGFLVGASLAVAGTSFQGLLRNPLADPYTLGVSSGAALGATAAMLFIPQGSISLSFSIPLFGFAGGLLALLIVYRLGRVGGRLPVVTVLLAGVIISSFFSALISLGMIFAGQQLRSIYFWLAGGLALKGWPYVVLIIPYFIVGLLVLLYYAGDLNIILLGEESALSSGVEVEKVKKVVLVAASLVTAGAVSVSGMIGFVGLIVPHAMRIIMGPDHRLLLPAAALGGGLFLVAVDTAARTVLAPVEIPVGIVTAFLGAPFFIILLRRYRDQYRF
ncbi:MAG: iron chelate uptake ABC transporter family permease subunit [Firmicutes bacterium]|nr:iron chelate uptake ABC transporter family permease subunit [Bacillota bacterium]